MSDATDPAETRTAVVAHIPNRRCPLCAHGFATPDSVLDLSVEPALTIEKLEQKAGKFLSTGRIAMSTCPACGAAVQEIHRVVPIELTGLTCACGSTDFQFSIKLLAPNKQKNPTDWNFDIDVICRKCKKLGIVKSVLGFFRFKRIKIDATGVDLRLK